MINVKDITWSPSRLDTYETCPYSWYLKYILKEKDGGSSWSDGGSTCHETVEEVLIGNLKSKDAVKYFIDHSPVLHFDNMGESYGYSWVNKTLIFLENLEGVIKSMPGEVIGVEEDHTFDFYGYKMRGLVDVVLKDGDDYAIWDWKGSGKSGFTGKKLIRKQRQLYIYAKLCKDLFGKYPKKMYFYLWREDNPLIEIDFSRKDYNSTKKWVLETIGKIENDTTWEKNESWFWCNRVCGLTSCPNNGNYNPSL